MTLVLFVHEASGHVNYLHDRSLTQAGFLLRNNSGLGVSSIRNNDNDNENTLFDHNIQIEITIYKQFN